MSSIQTMKPSIETSTALRFPGACSIRGCVGSPVFGVMGASARPLSGSKKAMDGSMLVALLEKACVLVTITFVLTRTRFFAHLLHPRQPIRQQATALLAFLFMSFIELALGNHQGDHLNARIVAVCAAGLIAGPWVGGIVGVTVTVLAVLSRSSTPLSIVLSMLIAGVAGGLIHVWRPSLALRPTTGFLLGLLISLLRYSLAVALPGAPHLWKAPPPFPLPVANRWRRDWVSRSSSW